MLCVEGARTRPHDAYVGERTMGEDKFPVIIYETKLHCECVQCLMLK